MRESTEIELSLEAKIDDLENRMRLQEAGLEATLRVVQQLAEEVERLLENPNA